MNNEKHKLHYKMYKSGKLWVVAGLVSTTMAFGMIDNDRTANADTTNPQNAQPTQVINQNGTVQTTNPVKDDAQINNSKNSSNASSASAASSVASSSAISASSSSSSSSTSISSTSSASASSASFSSSNNDKTTAAPNATKSQSSSSKSTSNKNKADKISVSKLIKKYKIKNIRKSNGNYYYYEDGKKQKSFAIKVGKRVLYFDDDNGKLENKISDQYENTLTKLNNDYTDHNEFYSDDSNSITNLDGYLTADTWYRPKDILSNGTTWTPSNENDLRPLLMSWWPDKKTEANYLNFMNSHGLGTTPSWHDVDESQSKLNKASQEVQHDIEKKITSSGNTDWLKDLMKSFVNSQPGWNIGSEDYNINDGFQGGSLLYKNSNLTPNANSNYRLLNRTPTQQDGTVKYTKDPYAGYEFLLANDVDNSNPVVQAEDLNWMYYLLNFGSIVKNDPSANFDSIRVDAVENMDADILDIASKYFKNAYNTNLSDKNANDHLSILEDWSKNDAYYLKDNGSNQLTIDGTFLDAIQADLLKSPDQRYGLESLINTGLVNRDNNNTENQAIPNYSIVRAHDNGVQDVIAKIIIDNINPKSNGFILTNDELNQAFKIYDADQKLTNKKYTQYNIPSAYALLLTNKDTIPRVYYGDLFTDDGQFMATKTPYYESISSMLQARTKYVSGGQSTNVSYVNGDPSMDNSYKGILTSVRYGKGALSQTDLGDNITRNSGIAVLESNNPKLKLSNTDKVVINMGAAHKNQAYRPLIDSSDKGLVTYDKDSDTSKVVYTNSQGQLILDKSNINGYSNPQESGYLSMWVPVGAPDNQDIRTAPSDKTSTDNKTLHSNSALDSNVIFEAFSNFQAQPTTNDEYENVILPQKTDLFNKWGVTYMQLPPQYRSTDDNSFLDSTIHNGYAFNDRYDLGFNTPTKYGNVDQLANTIKSLHSNNIKVMADFVPDQLYSLPNQQVVTATRVNQYGQLTPGSLIYNSLYAANSIGSGNDYQAKYGGEFLTKLQSMYPDLFNTKQVSTGVPIDPSVKIKTWEAKYFNGSNIQGRGASYVLNAGDNTYLNVGTTPLLPLQLTGKQSSSGFVKNGNEVNYYSGSGYKVKNQFVQDINGDWYYFNSKGNMVRGVKQVHGAAYYFNNNGVRLNNVTYIDDKKQHHYFGSNGAQYANGYYPVPNDPDGNFRYYDSKGVMAVGSKLVDGNYQYFDKDGYQIKDEWRRDSKGHLRYYQPETGNAPTSVFTNIKGKTYYFNNKGYAVTGKQYLYGKHMYFNKKGVQVKGKLVRNKDKLNYYLPSDGILAVNEFVDIKDNSYYFNNKGNAVTGRKTLYGKRMYFDKNGVQVKGKLVKESNGKFIYYQSSDGSLLTNGSININGKTYHFNENGYSVNSNK